MNTRISLDETVNIVVSDIKNAQFKALSTPKFNDQIRCGYGIADNPTNSNEYFIYAGPSHGSPLSAPLGAIVDCATQNRHYCAAPLDFVSTVACGGISKQDERVGSYKRLFAANLEFKPSGLGPPSVNFDDIFFEPPDPKTFICPNGASCASAHSALNVSPRSIVIGTVGRTCSEAPCRAICVYTSGKIEVLDGTACPP